MQNLVVPPPKRVPFLLRPALWLARRFTGKDPLPGRLLGRFPKGAVAAGLFELGTPHALRDLDARVLAVARVVASAVGGCPFCIDMNAATWREAGLSVPELEGC
jgi:AhpD family alkylhydroperoxidase